MAVTKEKGGGRVLEGAGLASEGAGRASDGAGWASKPAERAWEPAGMPGRWEGEERKKHSRHLVLPQVILPYGPCPKRKRACSIILSFFLSLSIPPTEALTAVSKVFPTASQALSVAFEFLSTTSQYSRLYSDALPAASIDYSPHTLICNGHHSLLVCCPITTELTRDSILIKEVVKREPLTL